MSAITWEKRLFNDAAFQVVAREREEEKKRIQMEKLAKAAELAALNTYVLVL